MPPLFFSSCSRFCQVSFIFFSVYTLPPAPHFLYLLSGWISVKVQSPTCVEIIKGVGWRCERAADWWCEQTPLMLCSINSLLINVRARRSHSHSAMTTNHLIKRSWAVTRKRGDLSFCSAYSLKHNPLGTIDTQPFQSCSLTTRTQCGSVAYS